MGKTTRWYEYRSINAAGWVAGFFYLILSPFTPYLIIYAAAFWLSISFNHFGGNTPERKQIIRQKITTVTALATGVITFIAYIIYAYILITT